MSSSKAISSFTALAVIKTFFGNVPLVFVWLALARNVDKMRNRAACLGKHVLGLVESPLGLLDRSMYQRNGNTIRDLKRVLLQMQSHGPKVFQGVSR